MRDEDGFVQGADLLYKCKNKTNDYHDEMDTDNFITWFNEKIIPKLPNNSIVIIDNAAYHSKQYMLNINKYIYIVFIPCYICSKNIHN